MTYPSAFDSSSSKAFIDRIDRLKPDTQPGWGKMNVAQMLAHLSVAYDMTYGVTEFPKANWLSRKILKLFVKPIVVGPKPYKKNSRTPPNFVIADHREFEKEKAYLIQNIKKTQEKGESFFNGRESASLGVLKPEEWSVMFSKHLDHHLQQFGV